MKSYLLTVIVLVAFFVGVYFFQVPLTDQDISVRPAETIPESGIGAQDIIVPSGNTMATLKTNFGDVQLELFAKDAPKTVANFIQLAKSGFYDGTKFHRVIPDFMIQGGDPKTKDANWADDGTGGPGYAFADEMNSHTLVRGALAMANSGPNTNGSQFFLVTAQSTPWLNGKHTVFGQVVKGMEAVTKIEHLERNQNDHPMQDAVIEKVLVE